MRLYPKNAEKQALTNEGLLLCIVKRGQIQVCSATNVHSELEAQFFKKKAFFFLGCVLFRAYLVRLGSLVTGLCYGSASDWSSPSSARPSHSRSPSLTIITDDDATAGNTTPGRASTGSPTLPTRTSLSARALPAPCAPATLLVDPHLG